MYRVIRATIVVIFLAAIAAGPSWVEDIQTDSLGNDINLDKLVTYQTRGESIGNVVDALAQASGVVLRAGTSSKDWEVRNRRVSIFAVKLPLRDLMNSLSRVTSFKWQITGEGPEKTYRLVWDIKSKAQAQELINKSNAVTQTAATDQVNATPVESEFYPGFGSTTPLTPQQQANLQLTDPFLAWWQKSGMAKAVGGLLDTVPGTSGAISSGSKFSVSGNQLNADGRKAVLKFLNRSNKNGGILGGIQGRGALRNIRKNLDNARINVNQSVSAGSTGSIAVSYGRWSISAPLINSKSATAVTIGNMYTKSLQTGKPVGKLKATRGNKGDLMRASDADASAAVSSKDTTHPAGKTGNEEAATGTDKNAAAVNKGVFKTSNKPLSIELMRANRLLKTSIVSDWFGDPVPTSESREALTAKPDDILDDIADRYSYTWDKPSAASEFKDAEWAEKSFMLLPDEWLAGFRKSFIETGTLDLLALAQMADLTPGQLEVGIETDEILGNAGISKILLRNSEILKLISILSNEERNLVFSSEALNLKTLPVGKIPIAKAAVVRNTRFMEKNDIPLLLRGEAKPDGKAMVYLFVVSLEGDNSQNNKWNIRTPLYNPKPARNTDTIGPKVQVGKAVKTTPKLEDKK